MVYVHVKLCWVVFVTKILNLDLPDKMLARA
jgi:hypothetical protein